MGFEGVTRPEKYTLKNLGPKINTWQKMVKKILAKIWQKKHLLHPKLFHRLGGGRGLENTHKQTPKL